MDYPTILTVCATTTVFWGICDVRSEGLGLFRPASGDIRAVRTVTLSPGFE